MEQSSFLPRSKSSSFSSTSSRREEKLLLPLSAKPQPKFRVRALLGHCLYRRVIIWSVTAIFLLSMGLMASSGLHHDRILELVDFKYNKQDAGTATDLETVLLLISQEMEENPVPDENSTLPNWIRYKHLDGYFNGLKALVPLRDYTPEYPRASHEESPFTLTISYSGLPTPTPYVAQPDYQSAEYIEQYHEVKTCYLDKEEAVPAPSLYAYNGIVQGQPEPVFGSHSLLGLRDDVCFDRFGRYGPYGLGYSYEDGGVEVGMDTEQEGSKEVWSKTGKINYDLVDWGDAQDRCYQSNKQRFVSKDGQESAKDPANKPGLKKISRTAVVIRIYVGFQWTEHAVLNFRAMISELALRSGGEYEVHFLLHVRDNNLPIWADGEIAQQVLDENVPPEFHTICALWSENQMRLFYPVRFGTSFKNPSNRDIHGVYRSAHFPLQHFAMTHPQYDHYWNWEMDMRWLGDYYELFDRLGLWAKSQSRIGIWERSAKYYIPHYHGSWDNFTELVRGETEASGRSPVFGPALFPGKSTLRAEERGQNFMPASCAYDSEDVSRCGVGEDADLITLNPIFDTEDSGWVFDRDVTGYDRPYPIPPRRSAIVTASRLSRRLLEVMHEETWRLHHNMFSEMFPASMALHHGLKAVYAPHPVYLDREWDLEAVNEAFNGGRDHSSGGPGSPFDQHNEHNHKGTSWYYNSEFAGLLWRRWLGYPQMDGRGEDGGRNGKGTLRGGREEEESEEGTGRLCLRSMLVHPIKREHPDE
ncbi:hypothetical protein B0H66DRAFT_472361 [Apodospora peruviana]|uniref:Major facilitator superfamily transporter n=1 Tax=Apodospora peruviana TaxID=516989 RepID=A0AAE0IJT4_9PEZI|nr:hypothetical protein B0H66DRAFT_472361 [Apodospora peruviana]